MSERQSWANYGYSSYIHQTVVPRASSAFSQSSFVGYISRKVLAIL